MLNTKFSKNAVIEHKLDGNIREVNSFFIELAEKLSGEKLSQKTAKNCATVLYETTWEEMQSELESGQLLINAETIVFTPEMKTIACKSSFFLRIGKTGKSLGLTQVIREVSDHINGKAYKTKESVFISNLFLTINKFDESVLFCNEAALKLVGKKDNRAVGTFLNDFLPGLSIETLRNSPNSTYVYEYQNNKKSFFFQATLYEYQNGNQELYNISLEDITNEVDTQDEVRQTLEQAIDAVVTIDGKTKEIIFYNKAAEKLWGYTSDEVIGKNVSFLVPFEHQKVHDSYVDNNIATGINKIVGSSRDVILYTKQGRKIHANLALSKIKTRNKILYTAFVKDITETILAQEQIKQTMEQAIDAVVIINGKNHEVLFFNKAAEELWEMDREEIIGKNVKELVPMGIRDEHDGYIDKNAKTGQNKIVGSSRDVQMVTKSGKKIWVNLALSKAAVGEEVLYTAFVKNIEDQVQARLDQENTNLILNTVLDGTMTGIWEWNVREQIVTFSPSYNKILGRDAQESNVSYTHWLDTIHPDDIEHVNSAIKDHFDGMTDVLITEQRVLNIDNQYIWTRNRGKIIRDEAGFPYRLVSSMLDISKEKVNDSIVQKLSLVASKTNNAVIITDPQCRIEWVNDAFEQLTGYSYIEVIGKVPGRVLQGEETDPESVAFMRQKIKEKKEFRTDILNYTKKGRKYWVNVHASPVFDDAGEIIHFIAVETDVTLKKQTEEKIKEANKRLYSINRDLEQANVTKNKFFSIISHDLKNPFNAIVGSSDYILENSKKLNKVELVNLVKNIHTSSKESLNLLENLLTWSRAQGGKVEVDFKEYNLNNVVATNVNMLQQMAESKGINLVNKIDPSIHSKFDYNTVNTIIRNLVTNAIKFTPHGGKVSLNCSLEKDEVIVEVRDTGVGMAPEDVKKLLDSNVNNKEVGDHENKGTGLGIELCKEFVELNKGRIWVESKLKKGTSFFFTLPYSVGEIQKEETEKSDVNLEEILDKLPKKKILIAEDKKMNQTVLGLTLKSLGQEFTFANNGQEALDLLFIENDYDLILMDIFMPEMDGITATKLISENRKINHIPIVGLTGSEKSEIQEHLHLFKDVLTKPINKLQLAQIIHQIK